MTAPIDASIATSDATTQGASFGDFNVNGGNSGTKWLPLALVALAALGLFLWFKSKK